MPFAETSFRLATGFPGRETCFCLLAKICKDHERELEAHPNSRRDTVDTHTKRCTEFTVFGIKHSQQGHQQRSVVVCGL